MKKEHLDIVWDSCSELEKANISFGEFLDKLGRAMESATTGEMQLVSEIARNLEVALVSGSSDEIISIIDVLKRQVAVKIRSDR
ncbi:MAG: hypothetical protein PHD82_05655 [Candidatus Riflebacteria bacterium]|jgi:hypothetical protein|nr:hypothetical protein [Candidatus Riflebacteria bacterium]